MNTAASQLISDKVSGETPGSSLTECTSKHPLLATQPISHRALVQQMNAYAVSSTWRGLALFIGDFGLYWAGIAGVIFLPDLWMKFAAGCLSGIKMAGLATLAHDAAHGSLTRSTRLNWLLAVLSFMPCLFNYRLWVYDHHMLHHPNVNSDHPDSYVPLSKTQFDALPRWKQWRERFYRGHAFGLSFGVYYTFQRWWQVKFFPRNFLPERYRASAWRHFVFLLIYLAGLLSLLLSAPQFAPVDAATAVLLGFVMPFYLWMTLMAFTLYTQHTDPKLPWFHQPVDREDFARQEYLSVDLVIPRLLSVAVHNVYHHAVHHVHPRIPCYRTEAAQQRMNELLGDKAVVSQFSIGWLVNTMRCCKLYDYERHCWTDFDGKPTTPVATIFQRASRA